MEKNLPWQTLHCHTNRSDGVLNYEQVLNACAQNGIGVVAFTDHDFLPGRNDVERLRRLKDHPVKYIFGVELTSGYPKEIYKEETKLFHVLGLFVDPFNKSLLKHTQHFQSLRRRKMSERIKKFNKLGFRVTVKDVYSQVVPGGVPSALNLVKSLISHRGNRKLLRLYVQKIKSLMPGSREIRELYEEMIQDNRGDKQKYFNIFMKDESPFKVRASKKGLPKFEHLVDLIRRAGGLAVIAHWSFDRESFPRSLLEKIARQGRIDGLEVVYDLFTKDQPFWKVKFAHDHRFLKGLAKRYNLFVSGGVDAHRKEDFRLFAKDQEYSGQTRGLVEKMLELKKPNLKNSSLIF